MQKVVGRYAARRHSGGQGKQGKKERSRQTGRSDACFSPYAACESWRKTGRPPAWKPKRQPARKTKRQSVQKPKRQPVRKLPRRPLLQSDRLSRFQNVAVLNGADRRFQFPDVHPLSFPAALSGILRAFRFFRIPFHMLPSDPDIASVFPGAGAAAL